MSPETIDGMRQLLDRTDDPQDIEVLRAFLVVVDAVDNGQPTDEEPQRCAKCQCKWPTRRLDDKGVCPNCLLDALFLRQRQWRMANFIKD